MKITQKIGISLIAAVCVTVGIVGVSSAQSPLMTDEQIERIRSNCVVAKNTLNQLHTSDALLRVNRGQIYEYMSTKLMDRFNGRASSNRFEVTDLTSAAQTYSSALATFRLSYQSYEEQLSKALAIDCRKEPVSFYDAVASARTKRTQVYVDVVKLHQHIDEYRSTVDAFEVNFQKDDQ